MAQTRTNPEHWVWQLECPTRFTPDEFAYLDLLAEMDLDMVSMTDALIREGMSAERVVALWQVDDLYPPEQVQEMGNGLAWWVQHGPIMRVPHA